MNIDLSRTPEIRAVLDRSALRSYIRGHVHVGDIIRMIADDDDLVAIPATTLLEAFADTINDKTATALLGVLITLEGVEVVDLGIHGATNAAASVSLAGGDLSRGHAIWTALEHEAVFFTTEPQRLTGILTEDQIIPIPIQDPDGR